MTIRDVVAADLPAIVAIYNHYIETDHCTFDTQPFTPAQRQAWFAIFQPATPYQCLVAELEGEIAGFAHSRPIRPKPAYDSSVETTVYLQPAAMARGLGQQLYAALLRRLEQQPSLHRAYALIAQPNPASNALHERLGFQRIGLQSEAGFKFGRYWDIAWYERPL